MSKSPSRPFEVRKIEHKRAKAFVERWHYSKKYPTGWNVAFGAYVDGELYAVANYGHGANMDGGKALAQQTGFDDISADNLLNLTRLCRKGEKGEADIAMTRFLSLCHRALAEDGFKYVVSYADPAEGGASAVVAVSSKPWSCGFIYAAANFKYLGKTDQLWHVVNRDGNIVHRRVAYRFKNRHNAKLTNAPLLPGLINGRGEMTMKEARELLGLTPIRTPSKERWFLVLPRRLKREKSRLIPDQNHA
jgi:hypothetical protein